MSKVPEEPSSSPRPPKPRRNKRTTRSVTNADVSRARGALFAFLMSCAQPAEFVDAATGTREDPATYAHHKKMVETALGKIHHPYHLTVVLAVFYWLLTTPLYVMPRPLVDVRLHVELIRVLIAVTSTDGIKSPECYDVSQVVGINTQQAAALVVSFSAMGALRVVRQFPFRKSQHRALWNALGALASPVAVFAREWPSSTSATAAATVVATASVSSSIPP